MKLIVDAMGGDHAPEEIVLGAVRARMADPSVELILTGDETRIAEVMKKHALPTDGVRIVHAPTVIDMEEDPIAIIKGKRDSSMGVALTLLRDGEGDALLSAGSTGALLIGSSSRIYKIKLPGIRRCAIGTVLPLETPTLLLDSGANIEVSPEEMVQFAHMGHAYMKGIYGLESPRVALVNNGAEETKGTELYVQSHAALKAEKDILFVGNIEGRHIPLGAADVVLCDGFVGNVILKLSEGFGKFIKKQLTGIFSGFTGKLAALLVYGRIKSISARLSYEKHGGAPLLGTCRPVIKAHGSSRASAIESAVRQAKKCYESGVCDMIAGSVREG